MDSHEYSSIPALKPILTQAPFVTGSLPGTGGIIKAVPEHFQVEEVLPYAACGEGEHVFVTVRRSGWNTADLGAALGEPFGIKGQDIGWAGRKDKHAVTTQTLSLRLPLTLPLEEVGRRIEPLPFEIIRIERHRNKLKIGHVAANRFRIVISHVGSDARQKADDIANALKTKGVPNYYGDQRFGKAYNNLERAAALVRRGKARGRKDGFTVSVLQSALFNLWLIERIHSGRFNSMLEGDVARKRDTGGLFIVEDLPEATRRYDAGLISYTGPIYGYKMMAAAGRAGEHERRVVQRVGLDMEIFRQLRAPGSRRPAVLNLDDLAIEQVAEGLRFSFTLPSGAYATTVLREFTKSPTDSIEEGLS